MSSTNSTAPVDVNESRAPQALVIVSVCPAIALILVALRLYTRVFLLKRVFWEDYAIVAAMVTSIIMSVFMGIAFTSGSGRHVAALTKDQVLFQLRISPGVHLNYIATHMFLKLSILLHYVRISVMAFEKRICYALIGVGLAGSVALLIVSCARCIPFEAIWTPNMPGARCVDTNAYFFAGQSHTLAMDFMILLVPLFILRHLNIPWQQRLLLNIVVGFGGMACVLGVLRLQVLRLSSTSPDKTWDSFFSAIYGTIEINLGITCACVITLRPLFRRWRWLSGGEAEDSSAVQVEQPRPRRRVVDPDHIPTIGDGGAQVRTMSSDDVELGAVDRNKVVGRTEVKTEVSCTSSATEGEDHSCEGSTKAGGSSEGWKHPELEWSFPKER